MAAQPSELVETTPAVLDRVTGSLPKKFPAAVADSILASVHRSATQLAAKLAV
ncbi:MAG TPA: hypothetical protein VK163_00750 [Opitutaceae bacterium]|nr:hypothetical protein [Opitutaceae bacterium]